METKPVLKSKTMFVNAVVAVLGSVALFVPQVAPWSEWVNANGATIMTVLGVVGVILRAVTKDKVSIFGE
jgi:hypothetical protein